jgi:hypothetical protein
VQEKPGGRLCIRQGWAGFSDSDPSTDLGDLASLGVSETPETAVSRGPLVIIIRLLITLTIRQTGDARPDLRPGRLARLKISGLRVSKKSDRLFLYGQRYFLRRPETLTRPGDSEDSETGSQIDSETGQNDPV